MSIPPEEAIVRLRDLTAIGMQIELTELDHDNLACVVRHRRTKKKLTVRGHLQRWQGTATRVSLHSRESNWRLILDIFGSLLPMVAIMFVTFAFIFWWGIYGAAAFLLMVVGAVVGLWYSGQFYDDAGLSVQYHDLKWTIRDALEAQLDQPEPHIWQADNPSQANL